MPAMQSVMLSGKANEKPSEDPFQDMPWSALISKTVHVDLHEKNKQINTAQHPEQPPWDDNSERDNQTQMDSQDNVTRQKLSHKSSFFWSSLPIYIMKYQVPFH